LKKVFQFNKKCIFDRFVKVAKNVALLRLVKISLHVQQKQANFASDVISNLNFKMGLEINKNIPIWSRNFILHYTLRPFEGFSTKYEQNANFKAQLSAKSDEFCRMCKSTFSWPKNERLAHVSIFSSQPRSRSFKLTCSQSIPSGASTLKPFTLVSFYLEAVSSCVCRYQTLPPILFFLCNGLQKLSGSWLDWNSQSHHQQSSILPRLSLILANVVQDWPHWAIFFVGLLLEAQWDCLKRRSGAMDIFIFYIFIKISSFNTLFVVGTLRFQKWFYVVVLGFQVESWCRYFGLF